MSSVQNETVKKPRLNSAFQRLMSVHWWMAGCYLILFVGGTFMARLPRTEFRGLLYDFHKSIGVLTMALLTWRILTLIQVMWKKYTKRLPKFSPQWWRNFALHALMYVFMWAVPIAGFFFSNSFRSNNVKFFWLLLPDLFPQNDAMVDLGRSLHFWLGYTFLAFIAVHLIFQWKVAKANWRRLIGFLKARKTTKET
ncbi:MAG: cytochrome b [Oscillatoriales cyanobacterium RU_3_3]|nr:cytochrome b [Microcoleus sp. SU_5_3]NJL21188.1 cytochrome b [Leptolyngbyaceae cyanobacterium SM1_3_5]NJM61921.1 cytochrome b [Oscillatoriales cyanobacterium RU_3_3]